MMNSNAAASSALSAARAAAPEDALAPATQIFADPDSYLGQANAEPGRRVADDQFEMFVACEPAEALAQNFALHAPDFITVHDIGTHTSMRLLAALAAAGQRRLNRLFIRRQGLGMPLATLCFVELELSPGRSMRVYSTECEAEAHDRQELARVLMAHSRLAAVMVGELPSHALTNALQSLQRALAQGPWVNRQLLLVPLSSMPLLAGHASSLVAQRPQVAVSTTPVAARPTEVWNFITGAWNHMGARPRPPREVDLPLPSVPPSAPPAAAPFAAASPRPAAGAAARSPAAPLSLADAYDPTHARPKTHSHLAAAAAAPLPPLGGTPQAEALSWPAVARHCASLAGVQACCIFHLDTQRVLAHAGARPAAERMAAKGAMLHGVMADASLVLGLGQSRPAALIDLAEHRLLLRPLPGSGRLAMHLVLDRHRADAAAVQAELQRLDALLPAVP